MGRAPCCEKMGLKKGPWTKEEDHLLISYINENGHGNWRALPKKAGLLRCGKSCRLRWTNYLRPDIKRGNFSKEEEDAIIKLHQALGNRWSAIAATLPGRTDNEIKNVWHTHLKKRSVLKKQDHQQQAVTETKPEQETIELVEKAKFDYQYPNSGPMNVNKVEQDMNNQNSPLRYSSCDDISSSSIVTSTTTPTTAISHNSTTNMYLTNNNNNNQELDQDFWHDVVSSQDQSLSPVLLHHGCGFNPTRHDNIDFWCDLFTRTDEMSDLLEF